MDKGTIFGFVFGFAIIVAAVQMHGDIRKFLDIPGAMIAFGGSVGALFISFPAKKVMSLPGIIKNCFFTKLANPKEVVKQLGELATLARREGLLSLEQKQSELSDPFLKRGLEMVVDGMPKDKLKDSLETDLACIQERHATGKKMMDLLAAVLPAFAMVATLTGLIMMLGELEDPSKIGAGMSMAMIGTLYGAFFANMVCLPLANKLEARSKEETLLRELMIQGLVSLVEGEAPRTMEDKLKVFLSPSVRKELAA